MSRPRGAPEGAPLRRSALKSVHWTDLPGWRRSRLTHAAQLCWGRQRNAV